MDSTGRIGIFVEVAKNQSFISAAKALGLTGPAVSKQVMLLEQELGVKLLHRTTRQVTLTDEGARYYERAKLALEELEDAAVEVRELRSIPKGTLKVNAPLSFSHLHLLPALSGFAKKYPALTLDVTLEDRTVDMQAEGFDVVIRIGAMKDSALVVRHLAACPIVLAASPEYLHEHGLPTSPRELKQHRLIGYSLQSDTRGWHYRDPQGKTGIVQTSPVFTANSSEMMVQAVLDGVGIAALPGFAAATYLAAGKMIAVLPEYETWPRREITAVTLPNRYRAAKVKLFIDWLVAACKAIPVHT